jgi:hypothetical protein
VVTSVESIYIILTPEAVEVFKTGEEFNTSGVATDWNTFTAGKTAAIRLLRLRRID